MDVTRISSLTPGGTANPIEVKVIRQWVPYSGGQKKERCYLFVDKHGDAVEALTSPVDRAYFKTIIMSQSCYRITEYICMHEKHTMKIVPQTVTLKIGKAAMFIQIPDVGFPSNYFNFTTYDNLHARLNKHQLLTDYIAKIVSVTDNMKQKSAPTRLKLKLEDPSGPFIEATLWDEIGTSFDKEIVKRLTSPIIVALTSMKVTEYQGTLQFSSTPATYIYLNPDIEQTKSLMAIFKHATPETAIAQLVSKSDALEAESNRNRVTIADLLLEKRQRHIGTRFTCVASISNINENRRWFYKGCTKCRRKLQPRGNTLACQDHGEISKPAYLYCLTAIIADETGSATATFFDEAVSSLFQQNCMDLVVNEGYTDPNTIPPLFHSIKGKLYILQLQFGKHNQPNSSPFTVNQVFQFTNTEFEKESGPPAPITPKKIPLHSTDLDSTRQKKANTTDTNT